MRQLIAVVALALAVTAGMARGAAARTDAATPPAAAAITGVDPVVAERGGTVTIAGRGFGGPNVRITVGGVAADVVSASGSKATFRVPRLAGPGATTVQATNPGGQSGKIDLDVRFDGHVAPVPASAAGVTKTVGRDGGTLAAGGMTLTVPAGALSDDHEITLTPILAFQGSPFAGPVEGARLEPQGLTFLKPAVLSMPIPAGYGPAEVHGFGFSGGGDDLHLVPPRVSGGSLEIDVWHFSGAGGSFGPFVNGASTWVPGTAETRALQEVAQAKQVCLSNPIPDCQSLFDTAARLAFDRWYQTAVKPGLQAALGAPSFQVETAFHEWIEWQGELNGELGTADAEGFVVGDVVEGHRLATNDVGDLTLRRLNNCTGTDVASQIRDVARMSDLVVVGGIDLEDASDAAGTPLGLPDVDHLIPACIHIEVDKPTFPAVAARGRGNALGVHAALVTFTGAHPTGGLTVALAVDHGSAESAGGPLDAQGQFQTKIHPASDATSVKIDATVDLDAGTLANLPQFLRSTFAQTATVSGPARDRVELQALGPNGFADSIAPIKPGQAAALRVRLAGDGVSSVPLSYALTGPGSLSSGPSGVTDANGEARFDYTSSATAAAGTATVTATIDGEGTSDSLTITIQPVVTVTVGPKSVTVTPGQKVQFTAHVQGAADQSVSWGATGGTIDTNGLYTAGSTAGTFGVAAASNADPSVSDTATVVVKAPPAGVKRLNNDGTVQAVCSTNGSVFDGRDSPFLATSWSDSASCAATGTNFAGDEITATGHATTRFDETYDGDSLVAVTASGSGSGSGTGDPGNGYGVGGGQAAYEITFSVAATTQVTVKATVSATGTDGDARVHFNCSGTTRVGLDDGTASSDHPLANATVAVAAGTTCQISGEGGGSGNPVAGAGSASFAIDVSFG